ncbi:bifunctional nuclease family protein [Microbacterium sp. C7(2022)]|uniref:bifunctional nuclease family protein n=1 Tax=Microbacterium sp. C7(2022) TaxID=2992759 RepID=UPI00237AE4F1|nr:bifunctional nuclease family protein [Microbacterium sp. C7(2022)]MDE0546037.1 bifunctional nuclease family protein [Microbacterium sp. C7(2022)]
MVQVRVAGIALDPAGQHVILLKPLEDRAGEGRILPIWIGAQEATSILVAVEGADTPRPLAHDLMRSMLVSLGAVVERVQVTRIDEGTYYAEIVVSAGGGIHRIDARPSDAIALACRTAAEIWVSDAVLAEAGIVDEVTGDDDADAAGATIAPEVAEARVDEFKRFLDDVDPDDFRG